MVTYKFTEHSKRRFRERFPEKVVSNKIKFIWQYVYFHNLRIAQPKMIAI